jgi:hypothetical protein
MSFTATSDASMSPGLSTSSTGGQSMAAAPAPVRDSYASAALGASGGQNSSTYHLDDEPSPGNFNRISRTPSNRPIIPPTKVSSCRPSGARSSSAGMFQSRIDKAALEKHWPKRQSLNASLNLPRTKTNISLRDTPKTTTCEIMLKKRCKGSSRCHSSRSHTLSMLLGSFVLRRTVG